MTTTAVASDYSALPAGQSEPGMPTIQVKIPADFLRERVLRDPAFTAALGQAVDRAVLAVLGGPGTTGRSDLAIEAEHAVRRLVLDRIHSDEMQNRIRAAVDRHLSPEALDALLGGFMGRLTGDAEAVREAIHGALVGALGEHLSKAAWDLLKGLKP